MINSTILYEEYCNAYKFLSDASKQSYLLYKRDPDCARICRRVQEGQLDIRFQILVRCDRSRFAHSVYTLLRILIPLRKADSLAMSGAECAEWIFQHVFQFGKNITNSEIPDFQEGNKNGEEKS